jgi:hypothetical protein
MKLLLSVLIASFYGLTIRLLFGFFNDVMPIMGVVFFFFVPYLIGYLTIILLPYKKEHTTTGAFFKPWLTVGVILLVTMFFSIEGAICWAMAWPVFGVLAGLGGLSAFSRKRRRAIRKMDWDFEKDEWEKPGGLKVSFLFLIPLLAGAIEGDRTSSFKELSVEKQVEIKASPEAVWKALLSNNQTDIKRQGLTFSSFFGFPHHLNTTVGKIAVGGSRVANYEKGLTFMETIEKIEPGRSLVLSIKTDPSRISKAVMDEHIVIGGEHVQLLQDEYKLEELSGGRTRLTLSSRFSINTPFNWYAGIWSKWLMSDILQEELDAVRQISGKYFAH